MINEKDIKQVLAMFDEADLKYVDLKEVYRLYYLRNPQNKKDCKVKTLKLGVKNDGKRE